MRTNRATFPARVAAVVAMAALGIPASCGGDESDDTQTAPPDETIDEPIDPATDETATDASEEAAGAAEDGATGVVAVLEDAVLRLEGVAFLEPALFVLGDPLEEYDASIEMYTLTLDSLDEIRSEFPETAEIPAEGSDAYTALLAHLDDWEELATIALDELEERRPDLEPATIEWAAAAESGDPGPPPQEYAELVALNPDAFEEYIRRCAEFAVSVGQSINCFGTQAPATDGSIEFTIGDVTYVVDPGPIDEFIVRPDFFGADLGPSESVFISSPPAVRDPGSEVDPVAMPDEPGPDETFPWPDDIDEYLATSGIQVVEDTTTPTPHGEIRRLTLSQGTVRVLPLLYSELAGGWVSVFEPRPLSLWIVEVDGRTVVAVLQSFSGSAEPFAAQVDAALETLRPVG